MFLRDWWYSVLGSPGPRNVNILLLGLDGSGKTTLLSALKHRPAARVVPTLHTCKEELLVFGAKWTVFDLGPTRGPSRRLWPDYFQIAGGVVFCVDASEPGRFGEAREELDALLAREELERVPFLVLGNKIDAPTAASEEDLRSALGVTDGNDGRPIELFMCSAVRGMGYSDGLRWLSTFLR